MSEEKIILSDSQKKWLDTANRDERYAFFKIRQWKDIESKFDEFDKIRCGYYANGIFSDQDAKKDSDSFIRGMYYETHDWSDDDALNDADPEIVEKAKLYKRIREIANPK